MKKPCLAVADFCLGVFSIVFFAVCWIQVNDLAEEAQVMPHIAIIIGWICAVGIIIKSFHTKVTGDNKKKRDLRQVAVGVVSFLSITLFMVFASFIGMYVSVYLSILAISLTISYFEHGWDGKQMLKAALFDLIVLAITYLLFGMVLKVNTPRGFLF